MTDPPARKLHPTPRRWIVYIALKFAILALATLVVLHLYGLL